MLLGRCRHCGSTGQRYYALDRRAKHRELVCFLCGSRNQYIDFQGRVVRAPRQPTEDEEYHASTEHDAHMRRCYHCQRIVTTEREREIIAGLLRGLGNKQIGYELGISEKTVKNHFATIFAKFAVRNRTEMALYAIRNNLLDGEAA